jgi:hypothetical protein
VFNLNFFAVRKHVVGQQLSEAQLDVLPIAAQQAAMGGFTAYGEIRREGWVQRDIEGNHRLAGMLAGMGGEVLLDDLLKHLLWEGGSEPAAVAHELFADTGHRPGFDSCGWRVGMRKWGMWPHRGMQRPVSATRGVDTCSA